MENNQLLKDYLTVFADHGITGLVIAMLFIVIFAFLRNMNKILKEAKDERSEISERWSNSTDKLSDAIDGLKDALKDSKR